MPFTVVLDACVLYPASLRDTLLRLAEVELYDVQWSQEILDEAIDNLVEDGRVDREQAKHLMSCLDEAFEDAKVPMEAVEQLVPAMGNDPKDRHVLAAAVHSKAELVVTLNLKDFAEKATSPHGVEAVHPDRFLLDALGLDARRVIAVLRQQADDCNDPPKTLDQVLDALAVTVPAFVAEVRQEIERQGARR